MTRSTDHDGTVTVVASLPHPLRKGDIYELNTRNETSPKARLHRRIGKAPLFYCPSGRTVTVHNSMIFAFSRHPWTQVRYYFLQCPPAFNPPGVVIGLTRRNNYDLTTPTYRYAEHTANILSSQNRCVRNNPISKPLIPRLSQCKQLQTILTFLSSRS